MPRQNMHAEQVDLFSLVGPDWTDPERLSGWPDVDDHQFAIRSLELFRYRCFNTLKLAFHPTLTVFSAPNGEGKTAILDGVAIALRLFVDVLQKKKSFLGFSKEDIQLYAGEGGTMENFLPHEPTRFLAEGLFWGDRYTWMRELPSANPRGKTTTKDAKELKMLALGMLKAIQLSATNESNAETSASGFVLPLISYYGTGRLFAKIKATSKQKAGRSRFDGYEECLNPNSSYKAFLAWYEPMSSEAQTELQSNLIGGHRAIERLEAVSEVIQQVLEPTSWKGIRWDFVNRELVAFHADGRFFPVRLLSDGIRNMLAMAADMAFRCSLLNGILGAEVARKTPGIVLIDEIEMHLHPEWQQVVIPNLMKAFPLIQFIITTHSPQVVSTVKGESIRVLNTSCSQIGQSKDSQPNIFIPYQSPYGHEAGRTLPTIFGVDQRPPIAGITDKLGNYYQLLREGPSGASKALAVARELADMGYQFSEEEVYQGILLKRYFGTESSPMAEQDG